MQRPLVGKRPTFHREKQTTNYYRVMVYISLILAGLWVLLGYQRGEIESAFQPTATPTRVAESYILEAEAYFNAGRLDDPSNNIIPSLVTADPNSEPTITPTGTITPTTPTPVPLVNDAIEAYQSALEIEPNNPRAWAELARIQAYSSNMLSNDTERLARLEEARASADKAVELAPDDSVTRAIRAFVLDWYAYNPLVPYETGQELLAEANSEANRAYQLDPNNALALAYYAEILADQSRWDQARNYAEQAVKLDPSLMDAHRVKGYVLETWGEYNSAIKAYQEAARITPNMTFLYIRIGVNYREGIKNPDLALEYFDKAAKINAQLGVLNPLPYIEIARTYTQLGQFFAAGINAQKALELDNLSPQTYGQLGMIYRRARNYEGAMPLLKCAVRGCTAAENEMGKVAVNGLPLTNLTVAYFYVEYGTNLAFLSRPGGSDINFCPEATKVLGEVRSKYAQEPTIMSIVEDSEGICRRVEGGGNTPAVDTTATPTPTGTPEP